jgi:hypothetical protein
MTDPTTLQDYYRVLPDGRCRMTALEWAGLEGCAPDRVISAVVSDHPCKVLLLDRPYHMSGPTAESGALNFYLLRIRIRDLQGWPPRTGPLSICPNPLKCSLRDVELTAHDALEYHLEWKGGTYKAWQEENPLPLLRCVVATLRQEGSLGRKLLELQDMRLVGCE